MSIRKNTSELNTQLGVYLLVISFSLVFPLTIFTWCVTVYMNSIEPSMHLIGIHRALCSPRSARCFVVEEFFQHWGPRHRPLDAPDASDPAALTHQWWQSDNTLPDLYLHRGPNFRRYDVLLRVTLFQIWVPSVETLVTPARCWHGSAWGMCRHDHSSWAWWWWLPRPCVVPGGKHTYAGENQSAAMSRLD